MPSGVGALIPPAAGEVHASLGSPPNALPLGAHKEAQIYSGLCIGLEQSSLRTSFMFII